MLGLNAALLSPCALDQELKLSSKFSFSYRMPDSPTSQYLRIGQALNTYIVSQQALLYSLQSIQKWIAIWTHAFSSHFLDQTKLLLKYQEAETNKEIEGHTCSVIPVQEKTLANPEQFCKQIVNIQTLLLNGRLLHTIYAYIHAFDRYAEHRNVP